MRRMREGDSSGKSGEAELWYQLRGTRRKAPKGLPWWRPVWIEWSVSDSGVESSGGVRSAYGFEQCCQRGRKRVGLTPAGLGRCSGFCRRSRNLVAYVP